MRCHKCGREYPSKKNNCIYCGASLDGEASQEINYSVDKETDIFISEKQDREVEFNDLPEHVRHKIENAIRKGKKNVIIKEEGAVIRPNSTDAKPEHALPLNRILALLSKMKDSFKKGHIEYNVYKSMVLKIMIDYISTLDDVIKVDFVVNEIKNSEIYEYLDDSILKDLRTSVISSVSDKKGFQEGTL